MFTKEKTRKFVKEISVPLMLIVVYLFVFKFQTFFEMPTHDTFLQFIEDYINYQSLIWIFLIALLESGLVLGQYTPGGVVIFLSIISAGDDFIKIGILLSVISVAFIIGYTLDYIIGYYGVGTVIDKFGLEKHIAKYEKLLNKNAFNTIFFTCIETNLASIVAVASGFSKVSFKKFLLYSAIGVVFWNVFWAIIIYFFGVKIFEFLGFTYILLIIFAWIALIFYRNFIKEDAEDPLTS